VVHALGVRHETYPPHRGNIQPIWWHMAFRDFTLPEVQQKLGVSLSGAALFAGVPAVNLREEFAVWIRAGTDLALEISTEKARSEFIIAPVLLELRRSLGDSFGIFSGIEFDVDASRGLNGFCDFILTKLPRQIILTAPLVAIVEAKNDNVRNGLGQCIAAMVAAQEFNRKADTNLGTIYGVVTTGSAWKFLQLRGAEVTVDIHEYYINDLERIMGILTHILRDVS
jgi:hypothetical protein